LNYFLLFVVVRYAVGLVFSSHLLIGLAEL
jgi:hypothetical protein